MVSLCFPVNYLGCIPLIHMYYLKQEQAPDPDFVESESVTICAKKKL